MVHSVLLHCTILKRADSHAHRVHLLILVVSLTIYGSLWELTGRDMRLVNLCNILCSQQLIKGKQVLQADDSVLNLATITYSICELYIMGGKHRSAKEIPFPDENSKDKASKTIL